MKSRVRLGLLLGLLGALLAVHLLQNLEVVIETEREPPSAEAQRNPFLAVERTLARLDVPVSYVRGRVADLPHGAGVMLIWPAPRGAIGRRTPEAVERFVQEGGHLLLASQRGADPLLNHFEIYRLSAPDSWEDEACDGEWDPETIEFDPDDVDAADEDDCDEVAPPAQASGLATLRSRGLGEPPLQMSIRHDFGLKGPGMPQVWVGAEEAPGLVQIEVGAGRVTAMTSLGAFHNTQLGSFDHAEALYRLLQQPQPVQRVLIVRTLPGGLWEWLREHAWRVMSLGAVVLILALWAMMPRFGPVAPDPLPQRRRLHDHLLASGRLLWSGGERGALAAAAADAALARVRAEYPHTRWLDEHQLGAFLQSRLGLDPGLIDLLLRPRRIQHPAAFIAALRACQRIHAELSPRRTTRPGNPLYDR